jgi:hypothetical protein
VFNFFSYFQHVFSSGVGQFKRTSTPEQEQKLSGCMQAVESRLFSITTKDPRKLVYQLAEKDKLPRGFNREDT